MNWHALSQALHEGQEIMIMTHDKPDGDAWGSVLGFGLVLEGLGYRPVFIHAGLIPSKMYAWMPGQHLIKRTPAESLVIPPDTAVFVLDCGDLSRCEFALAPEEILLNIDHHISNPGFGRMNWVEHRAGATAQIICSSLTQAGIGISPEAATCFYLAFITDTGGFRFSNTSPETLRLAAALMDLGADVPMVRHYMWENRPRQELPLLQEMMRTMTVFAEGFGVICTLSHETILRSGIHEAETDTALEAIRSVEDLEVVALLKEAEPGMVKVSLRSKDLLDCAQTMGKIGGGGHFGAAGATLHEGLAQVREKVIGLLTEELERLFRG
ncbi:MAG: DHH family phosphoesterase [Clostridiales bacterium]|nr:DHH family phosphoesterase [Clostridiales bacterium]